MEQIIISHDSFGFYSRHNFTLDFTIYTKAGEEITRQE